MKISEYKSYDDLPLFPNAAMVQRCWVSLHPSATSYGVDCSDVQRKNMWLF